MQYRILNDDELMHYGVKGMKWGKRKTRSGGTRYMTDNSETEWRNQNIAAYPGNVRYYSRTKNVTGKAKPGSLKKGESITAGKTYWEAKKMRANPKEYINKPPVKKQKSALEKKFEAIKRREKGAAYVKANERKENRRVANYRNKKLSNKLSKAKNKAKAKISRFLKSKRG